MFDINLGDQVRPKREHVKLPESETENPVFKTDDFRMYCFKIVPCNKRFSHDWVTCPLAHPGEKARRRDPRTYSSNACTDMKKFSTCPRGDTCPYAHNVFEYWLHPARYRTQLCTEGTSCTRKVCFFAHSVHELRTAPNKQPESPTSEQLFYSGSSSANLAASLHMAARDQHGNTTTTTTTSNESSQLQSISDYWDAPTQASGSSSTTSHNGSPSLSAQLQMLGNSQQQSALLQILKQQQEQAAQQQEQEQRASAAHQQLLQDLLMLQNQTQTAQQPALQTSSPTHSNLSVEQLAALLKAVGVTVDSLSGQQGAQLIQLLSEQGAPNLLPSMPSPHQQASQEPAPGTRVLLTRSPAATAPMQPLPSPQANAQKAGNRNSRRNSTSLSLPLLVIPEDPCALPAHSTPLPMASTPMDMLMAQLPQQQQGQQAMPSPYAMAAAAALISPGYSATHGSSLVSPMHNQQPSQQQYQAAAAAAATQAAAASYHNASNMFDLSGRGAMCLPGAGAGYEEGYNGGLQRASLDSGYGGRSSIDSSYGGGLNRASCLVSPTQCGRLSMDSTCSGPDTRPRRYSYSALEGSPTFDRYDQAGYPLQSSPQALSEPIHAGLPLLATATSWAGCSLLADDELLEEAISAGTQQEAQEVARQHAALGSQLHSITGFF